MGSQPTATIASAANNPPLSKQEVLACMPAFCLRMGSVVQEDYLAGKPPAQSSRGTHNATRERKLCAFASLWMSIRLERRQQRVPFCISLLLRWFVQTRAISSSLRRVPPSRSAAESSATASTVPSPRARSPHCTARSRIRRPARIG